MPLTETRPERTAAATRAREADEEGGEGGEVEVEVVEAAALVADEFESASRDDRNVSSLNRGGLSDGDVVSGDVTAGDTSDKLTRKVVGGAEEGADASPPSACKASLAVATSAPQATRAEAKRLRCCSCTSAAAWRRQLAAVVVIEAIVRFVIAPLATRQPRRAAIEDDIRKKMKEI